MEKTKKKQLEFNESKEKARKAKKNEKVSGVKNLLKMRKYFKGLKGHIFGMIALDIVVFAIQILLPLVMAQVLVYFTNFDFDKIVYFMVIWFGLEFLKLIVNRISGHLSNRWLNISSYKLKNDFIKKYLSINSQRLDKQNSGIITTRFVSDCNAISDTYNKAITDFIGIVAGVVYVFIGFWVSWQVALYLFVEAILTYILNSFVINKDAKYRLKSKELSEKVAGINNETIRGWRDVKALGLKDAIFQRTKQSSWEQTDYQIKRNDKIMWIRTAINIFLKLINVGFYVLCALLIYYGRLDLAGFLVLYLYGGRIVSSLNNWTRLKQDITSGEIAAKRVFELFDEDEYPSESWGTKDIKCNGNIKFSNVSFSYDGKKDIFKNLSFEIESNQMVAFVGESGIGKSTILSLLTKNYEPTKGRILLDKTNIARLSEEALKNNITLVQQTPYIFNVSIKENLLLVKPNATDEEIQKVCEKAQLKDLIESLPEKYDSLLGENGVILSGGQKQRLAIARGLLKNSKILLFDEATSALDNKTQSEIKAVLDELKKDHTIVVVAHRLSTIIDADKIIVLKDGKIQAEGRHQELLQDCENYQELYKLES